MKFNEINQENWQSLKPYVDTCILPVTGLTGNEQPWQVTHTLEQLRDTLAKFEVPFYGRTVTYPAVQYAVGQNTREMINEICSNLKHTGFQFVVVVTIFNELTNWQLLNCDLVIVVEPSSVEEKNNKDDHRLTKQLIAIWQTKSQ